MAAISPYNQTEIAYAHRMTQYIEGSLSQQAMSAATKKGITIKAPPPLSALALSACERSKIQVIEEQALLALYSYTQACYPEDTAFLPKEVENKEFKLKVARQVIKNAVNELYTLVTAYSVFEGMKDKDVQKILKTEERGLSEYKTIKECIADLNLLIFGQAIANQPINADLKFHIRKILDPKKREKWRDQAQELREFLRNPNNAPLLNTVDLLYFTGIPATAVPVELNFFMKLKTLIINASKIRALPDFFMFGAINNYINHLSLNTNQLRILPHTFLFRPYFPTISWPLFSVDISDNPKCPLELPGLYDPKAYNDKLMILNEL
jgi:hypothetical protein